MVNYLQQRQNLNMISSTEAASRRLGRGADTRRGESLARIARSTGSRLATQDCVLSTHLT